MPSQFYNWSVSFQIRLSINQFNFRARIFPNERADLKHILCLRTLYRLSARNHPPYVSAGGVGFNRTLDGQSRRRHMFARSTDGKIRAKVYTQQSKCANKTCIDLEGSNLLPCDHPDHTSGNHHQILKISLNIFEYKPLTIIPPARAPLIKSSQMWDTFVQKH